MLRGTERATSRLVLLVAGSSMTLPWRLETSGGRVITWAATALPVPMGSLAIAAIEDSALRAALRRTSESGPKQSER